VTHYDVVVVGAGVAGSTAALALARGGAHVLLCDGKPVGRNKVCGEFLSPESRQVFARLGVEDSLTRAAILVTSARILTSRRVGQAIAFERPGLALSRHQLDSLLFQWAIAAGANSLLEARASFSGKCAGSFVVETPVGNFESAHVIWAGGRDGRLFAAGSPPRRPGSRFLGLKCHLAGACMEVGQVQLFPFSGGYCGLVALPAGSVNACLLVRYTAGRSRHPEAIWQEARRQNRALDKCVSGSRPLFGWLATANVQFGTHRPVREGILQVGDAAGYIHPLTGDGMAMAARSGELAAATVLASLRGGLPPGDVPALYALAWHREFDARLRCAGYLQTLALQPQLARAGLAVFDSFRILSDIAES
jgi:flavin-dependent dehydrogenase